MAVSTSAAIPVGVWSVDPVHSSIRFAVKHLGIATVRGSFSRFEGALVIPDDHSAVRVRGSVDVDSISTNEPQRDAHLRSPDFFDAAAYPRIEFQSTRIEPVGDGRLPITGDLGMHGVTREIVLDCVVSGRGVDADGNDRLGLELTGRLRRSDFEMRFNQVLGSGNLLVSDAVDLSLDVSAVRTP